MCVGFWSLEHPDYALILCTNRDEYLSRPTENAHFHSFGQHIDFDPRRQTVLSGLDEQAGGSWLGINQLGKVAVLTNITEPYAKYSTSRGHLVSSFLLSGISHSLHDEVEAITAGDAKYAGFNLLLLAPSSRGNPRLSYDGVLVSNGGGEGTITYRPLSYDERLCSGLSNGIEGHGARDWPKVKHGIESLKGVIEGTSSDTPEADLVERLFRLLTWRSADPVVDRSHLRKTILVDPLEISGLAGSAYYGTRLSTVILVGRDGRVVFIERDIWTMTEEGKVEKAGHSSERVFQFHLSSQTMEDRETGSK